MRWRQQPTSSSCGHTCVAMITGRDPAVYIRALGDRPTNARDLSLMLLGDGSAAPRFRAAPKLRRLYGSDPAAWDLPPLAILRCLWDDETAPRGVRGHWIVWSALPTPRVLDPSDPAIHTMAFALANYRVTSLVEVRRWSNE